MFTSSCAKKILNAIVSDPSMTNQSTALSAAGYNFGFHANSIYLGLSSSTPTYSGSNFTEPTSSSYNRVLIYYGSPFASSSTTYYTVTTRDFSTAATYGSSGSDYEGIPYITNTSVIQFDEIHNSTNDDAWLSEGEYFTYFGLFTSNSSSDTPFFVGRLTSPIPYEDAVDGHVILFRKGELVISMTGAEIESGVYVLYSPNYEDVPTDSTEYADYPAIDTSTWHRTLTSIDCYATYSIDGGATWGSPPTQIRNVAS